MAEQDGGTPDRTLGTDGDAQPVVIVLGDAVALTRGGQGSSTEDKRYQYG
jgi:hypothetical protein